MIQVNDDKTRRGVIDLLVKNNLPVEDLDENKSLYALVQDEHIVGTGSEFFAKEGFETINREIVPDTIKSTSEFSSVCPSSAIVMKKKII